MGFRWPSMPGSGGAQVAQQIGNIGAQVGRLGEEIEAIKTENGLSQLTAETARIDTELGDALEREPDSGLRDVPELLSHVRQALGHDGNGRHGGPRVWQHLRPRRDPHPDEQTAGARRYGRRGLQDEAREVQRRGG